jgi:hypothetical protein
MEMKLTAEQISSNWDDLSSIIDNHIYQNLDVR